jgi:mycothiol synthase
MSNHDLPAGYVLQEASLEDARAIADLVNEVNVAEVGFPWTNEGEVHDDLIAPRREPGDHVVAVAGDGGIVAYLNSWRDEPLTTIQHLAFVRPALWGRGLSTWLLRSGEERSSAAVERERPEGTVHLRVARWSTNTAAGSLFTALGYRYARTFHEMRIELDGSIAAADVPAGIVVRTFDRERDVWAAYEALAEAFEDHWGSHFEPFDDWRHDHIDAGSSNFDASLWFLALEGERVVGVACCRNSSASSPDAANVDVLGVRRPWRGRGIGRCLLLTAFAEVRRRGIGAVELGVDSESPTGATRLYERAGMRHLRSFEHWDKLLQAPVPEGSATPT